MVGSKSKNIPKSILITGAGSGLGEAIARRYATDGWSVAVADLDKGRAEKVAAELGEGSAAFEVDVADYQAVQRLADEVWDRFGSIDVVVNNAGVAGAGSVADTDLDEWRRIMRVDLDGVFACCHWFAPRLVEQGVGHIVNVASFAGIACAPEMAAYNAAKAGVIALSETLRSEMADHGVGVSVACPAFFQTRLLETFESPDDGHRTMAAKMMERSSVTAEDVADDIHEAVASKRFMIISHREARWAWRVKRFAPEFFFHKLSKMRRKKMSQRSTS